MSNVYGYSVSLENLPFIKLKNFINYFKTRFFEGNLLPACEDAGARREGDIKVPSAFSQA